ncbi:MAG TPA: TRAP transporter small permease subunit [Burkholderiales bacterium]|nr:TRAP transporter small permease subunit [Burkholderiales bacterium]
MRPYRLLLEALAWMAGVLLGVMALAVTFDVLSRNLGLANTGWVVEVTEYSLPVATLLVAPWLLHRNEHVRLDALLLFLPVRKALLLERCADAVGILICAVFIWFGTQLIFDSARLGSMMVKTLAVPEWWQYVLVPVSFSLLLVEFVRRLIAPPLPQRQVAGV